MEVRSHKLWVRGSTIHSFKGWEARAGVLSAEEAPGWPEAIYTALTRVKATDWGGRHTSQ